MNKRGKPASGVGYRKPPRATQFKRGKSGNPKGRPRGSKNLNSIIQKELRARVPVTENGSRKMISKERAIAKQLVNRALTGDARLLSLLIKAAGADESESGAGNAPDRVVGLEDQLVMASIVQRIRQMDEPPPLQGPVPDEPAQSETPPKSDSDGESLP
jgi:hypothetical protein